MGKLDAGADPVRRDQPVVTDIAFNLEDAAKALQ